MIKTILISTDFMVKYKSSWKINSTINTVSQKKGSSSGDQFQIFQIFCYGVMGRDGLTTLRPKKVRPDPLAGRPGPL